MADKKEFKYFRWIGDPDAQPLPFVTRELAGMTFPAPHHIARTSVEDKIKFLTESGWFEEVTKTEYEVHSGETIDSVLETADIGSQGLSAGSGAEGRGGNGSSTPG